LVSTAALVSSIALVAVVGAEPVIPDEVIAKARIVSGKQDVVLEKAVPDSSSRMDEYRDTVRRDKYWYDKSSGKIRYFADQAAYSKKRGRAVSKDVVAARGQQYAGRVYNAQRLAAMAPHVELVDEGAERNYIVEYTEHIGNVRTFNYLRITYAEDGTLLNSSQQEAPVTVSLDPKITSSDAISVLADRTGLEKWAQDEAELIVYRTPDGQQELCWRVFLHTGTPAFGASFMGRVDAITGEIKDYAST
jgi:hypothetical protein